MTDRKTTKHSPQKKAKYKIHWFRIILAAVLLVAVIGCGIAAGAIISVMKDVPSLEDTDFNNYAITTSIMDMNGNLVDNLHAEENRVPVTYDEISLNAVHALIAIEDQRFEKHNGVDPIRIGGAMLANIKAGRIVQGGSTITQQLVGLVMLDRNEKSYTRKLKEAVLAVQMEREYSKEEIITHYLNRAYFGGGAYGIEAAAQYFFAKNASELTVPEAATLAGMIQNPSKWSPISYPSNALSRRNLVLDQMVEMGYLTTAQAAQHKASEIVLSETRVTANETTTDSYANQSFVDHVIEEALTILELEENAKLLYTSGYVIHTTLDPKVQQAIEKIYFDDSNFPSESLQSAMIITEPSTGAIRGVVGGRHQTGSRQLNRATQAFRQPGSAFKPIMAYGPAFEAGYGPGTVVDDYPKVYGGHMFRNSDYKYRGLVTIRDAIRRSTNVVAVKTLEMVGVEAGYQFAKSLGFSMLGQNDMNLSAALGGLSIGVSPMEMAGAYGAFANEGVYIPPYAITKITDKNGKVLWEHKTEKQVVMSEETAYMVTDCLIEAVSSGTGNRGNLSGRQTAGKTGTTSDSKDVWFAGYTKQYVGIVWMGHDTPAKIPSGYGGSMCGPIFNKVMTQVHEGLPAESFTKPAGVVTVSIDTKSGLQPSELTPSEYVGSGMFNSKYTPQDISTAWQEVYVDPLSGELFTTACPGVPEVRVSLHREVPWQNEAVDGIVPADASLEITIPCSLHSGGSVTDPTQFNVLLNGRGQYNQTTLAAVQLSWNKYGDEDTVYLIHRSNFAGFTPNDSTAIGNSAETTYSDYSPSKTGTNYYRVVAIDAVTMDQLAVSNEFSVPGVMAAEPTTPSDTPSTGDQTTEPAPPVDNGNSSASTSVALSGSSQNGAVNLFWNSPGSGQFQYYVFRSTSSGFTPGSSNQIGKNSVITDTAFTDTTAAPGTLYYYKVLVYDTANNSKAGESNQAQVQN